ncbi:MAG TPA: hypothetical protein VF789_04885 [Thermoanaerobaculia bacterium]
MTLDTRELLAAEFLRDWKTYAVAELDKRDPRLTPEANERRLDLLTRTLFEAEDEATADSAARAHSIELLAEWLAENDDEQSPMWVRFKLRHILYLHMMNRKEPALQELISLLERDQRFTKSAALQCLWGNLLAYAGQYEESMVRLDTAIRLAPKWAEPQLERVEKLILLKRHRDAANSARDYLKERSHNGRTQVILRSNLLIARCMHDADYPGGDEYLNDMLAAKGVTVDYRESWKFADVMNVIVDSALAEDIKREMVKFLREISAKIRPATESTDPDPYTKFG